jgi:hypothetical protein
LEDHLEIVSGFGKVMAAAPGLNGNELKIVLMRFDHRWELKSFANAQTRHSQNDL